MPLEGLIDECTVESGSHQRHRVVPATVGREVASHRPAVDPAADRHTIFGGREPAAEPGLRIGDDLRVLLYRRARPSRRGEIAARGLAGEVEDSAAIATKAGLRYHHRQLRLSRMIFAAADQGHDDD